MEGLSKYNKGYGGLRNLFRLIRLWGRPHCFDCFECFRSRKSSQSRKPVSYSTRKSIRGACTPVTEQARLSGQRFFTLSLISQRVTLLVGPGEWERGLAGLLLWPWFTGADEKTGVQYWQLAN